MAKANSTTLRVRKDVPEALAKALDLARNGTSLATLAETLLREAAEQINSDAPPTGTLPTIALLRQQAGKVPALSGGPDLATRVLQLEQSIPPNLGQLLERLVETTEEHEAARKKTKQATPKKKDAA